MDAGGTPENENKSAERPYIHDDAEENYKSTYLLIAPLIDTHEVTFNSMGGSEVNPNPVEVEDGKTVVETDDPTREGYTSTNDGVTLDEEYNFTTPVTESFTLYAKWEAVETEDPDDPEPGYDDGLVHPEWNIARAEAMAMVNRVLQRIPQDHTDLISSMKMWPDNANMAKWYYLTA